MLKKTITYTNFFDEEVTEDLYFNFSKMELVEMAIDEDDFAENIKRIVASENVTGIVEEFKKIILMAYGEKSLDGKRFVKNDAVRETFSQTAAFEALYWELGTNDKAAAEFINGIFPKGLQDELLKQLGQDGEQSVETVELPEHMTREELENSLNPPKPKAPKDMSRDELIAAFNAKAQATQG